MSLAPAQEPSGSTPQEEVTLGFAQTTDGAGEVREMPEAVVLATILVAVEADRRSILRRFAGGFDEEVDAVAKLYWPFRIAHNESDGTAAVFDGTGVWSRTFRYTLLPPMEGVHALLDGTLSPAQVLAELRALAPSFGRDGGADVLTVEGFLPVDPPLLFDILSHSRFRIEPQAPHPAFLPTRQPTDSHHRTVERMQDWLRRYEGDLRTLTELRTAVEKVVRENEARLEEEYRQKEELTRREVQAAIERSNLEVDDLEKAHLPEVQRYLEVIRRAQTTVARNETTIATSDALASRANLRRADGAHHLARGIQAQDEIRNANRQVHSSRQAIERIHRELRADHERAIAKVVDAERTAAKVLAELELFRDEFHSAGADLLQAIDGQVAARASQRNVLAGYFLPLPTLTSVQVVWLPVWLATLRGSRGIRQIVFPPMQVRQGVGLGGALKRLFGGVVLPLEPRTAQFEKVLRPTMEEALARDPWIANATQELTRAADALVEPEVLVRLQEGLEALRRERWITAKQAREFLNVYTERARRRTTGTGEGSHPAPPAPEPSVADLEGETASAVPSPPVG